MSKFMYKVDNMPPFLFRMPNGKLVTDPDGCLEIFTHMFVEDASMRMSKTKLHHIKIAAINEVSNSHVWLNNVFSANETMDAMRVTEVDPHTLEPIRRSPVNKDWKKVAPEKGLFDDLTPYEREIIRQYREKTSGIHTFREDVPFKIILVNGDQEEEYDEY